MSRNKAARLKALASVDGSQDFDRVNWGRKKERMSEIGFFNSYTEADEGWATWIAWQLEEADYACTLQAWDFRPGGDFVAQMREAMGRSRQTIAVVSKRYLESEFAGAELNAALAADPLGEKSKLIPVLIESLVPPEMLRARVYIDLVGKDEDGARRALLDGVRASRATRLRPEEAVRFPSTPTFPRTGQASASPVKTVSVPPAELRILFLAATTGVPLDLKREFQDIDERVKASAARNMVELTSEFDVDAESFQRYIFAVRPHVLHFSGNMSGESLYLESRQGGFRAVPVPAMVGLIRTVGADLRLVFLNACKSVSAAQALAEVVGVTIGIEGDITDDAAISFAADFYEGVADGSSVSEAFAQAEARLAFKGIDPSNGRHKLMYGPGIDPSKLVLVAAGA